MHTGDVEVAGSKPGAPTVFEQTGSMAAGGATLPASLGV